ncbi:hypothetical protein F5Y04DRAFT_246662 [Hypomontagnella monticulosa]|nr:hypothetical protein F5Y04DRAFT_246662 [Hypomontagnella monticulosa]
MAETSMEATTNDNVQLLAVLVDPDENEESEYRFLVDGRHVKYVTVAPGILAKDKRTFALVLIPGLPPFPPGDWNEGHVGHDSASGKPSFIRTVKADLAGVKTTWHATYIDHLELHKLDHFRQNIHKVSHPLFDHPVVAKFTEFPWQTPYLEAETVAYQWIEGSGIAPRFLGHLTEEGRVIGFVLEYIENAKTAGPEDLAACQGVLKRLHSLGIKHGDINKYNLLVQGDRVFLLDFESAKKGASLSDLEAEYQQLGESLRNPSLRGGIPQMLP